jgi:hypothetical protein
MEFSNEIDFGKLLKDKEDVRGPMLSFDKLDFVVGGLNRRLVVLGGFSGTYKTTFALNIAYFNAVELGYTVIFLTLEMDRNDLWLRLLLRHAQNPRFRKYNMHISVPNNQWRYLSSDVRNYLESTVGYDLNNNQDYGSIIILDADDLSKYQIDGLFDAVSKKLDDLDINTGIDLFIIDYIQLFSGIMRSIYSPKSNKYQFVGDVIRYFKKLTQTYTGKEGNGINVIALSQLNREGFKDAVNKKGKYNLTSFAESSEIVNAADLVITLYADSDDKKAKQCRVQLLKNRFGETIEEPVTMIALPENAFIGNFREATKEEMDEIVNGFLGIGTPFMPRDYKLDINYECEKCHGDKILHNAEGEIIPCSCIVMNQLSTYIDPIKYLITPNTAKNKPIELAKKSQAIVHTNQNMAGLIELIVADWFQKKYIVTTLDQLNAIGFSRHPEFQSVIELACNSTNFILDCSFFNKIRSQNESITKYDSLYAIELIRNVVANKESRIIIILPLTIHSFMKTYQELCECLAEFGIEYFMNGKYRLFTLQNKEANNGQPSSN